MKMKGVEYIMQTIDRAMQVIKVLAESDTKKWFSITDLSKECDLPVSTMHRLITIDD